MSSDVSFVLDGSITTVEFPPDGSLTPTTTVLNYLRDLPEHRGVKEGCAEGDCGACTVVLGDVTPSGTMRYRAVDSCLVFLPMLHGKHLLTVENLRSTDGALHPVQLSMVETGGSQCGFCTPGIIMSLFALYRNTHHPSRTHIDDALTGNLCRCTGYRPIIEAAAAACVHGGKDHLHSTEQEIATLIGTMPHESIHIKTSHQEYYQPVTLKEALDLKHRHPETIVINGATDIALRVTKKHEVLKRIIDLSAVEELRSVSEDESSLTLGGGLPLTDVLAKVNGLFPALSDMLSVFGSVQIRNLATLGGNLGTASPIGDALPVLMSYNARVVLQSISGKREVPVSDFVKGYRQTDRRIDELITGVVLPKLPPHTVVRSYKVSKRKDLDISTLSSGFRLRLNPRNNVVESIRLAYGGMADRVKRARTVEQFLIGKRWERETVEQAMQMMDTEFTPIADARSGAEFRRVAARNLLLKFWSETESVSNGK